MHEHGSASTGPGWDDAIAVLHDCASPHGFGASAGFDHYAAIWTRDACISVLGAIVTDDADLHEAAEATLATASSRTSALGQLPNAVWPDRDLHDFGEGGTVDASAWWVVAELLLARHVGRAPDVTTIEAALRWLRHRDTAGFGLVQATGATDWMESTLHRHGWPAATNMLMAWALRLAEDAGLDTGPGPDAAAFAATAHALFWPDDPSVDPARWLWEQPQARDFPHSAIGDALSAAVDAERRHHLIAFRFAHPVDRLEPLSEALAIIAGVTPPDRHDLVLDGMAEAGVADPHATVVLHPPAAFDDVDGLVDPVAEQHQGERWRNPPGAYHNGGAWPWVGGLHALAARAAGRRDLAAHIVDGLTAANVVDGSWQFPEWRHAITGAAGGSMRQAWSGAGQLLGLVAADPDPTRAARLLTFGAATAPAEDVTVALDVDRTS